MAETTKLMTIGEFSSLTRLSVRMLRHYDTHGVLVPADVDAWTGYRRYSPEQLRDAADIRNLRDVGFGVSAISALLAARGTSAWASALELQRQTLVAEQRAAQTRLALITTLLSQGEPSMSITVERTTVPAQTLVALHGVVPTYSDEGQLWQQFFPLLQAQGITPIGPCGVIEHCEEYTEHDVELSVFFPVAPGTTTTAPLQVLELPERDCLVAHVAGPYDQITTAHDMINSRLAAEGLTLRSDGTLAAKPFNHYLVTPDQAAPEDLVTDVFQPIS